MKKIINIFFSIFLSLFIIGGVIKFTVEFKELYYFDIKYLNIESLSNLKEDEIKLNYDYLIDYNLGKVDKDFEMPTIPSSKNGKIHFEEVRAIVQNVIKLFYVCGIICLVGIIINIRKKNIEFLKITSISLIVTPIALAIPILIDFQKSFVIFHEMLFDNDYWIFDQDLDPVINMLPNEFFLHSGLMILGLTLIISILLYIIYKKLRQKTLLFKR